MTLDELWAEMLLDACASDGPIRDNDVRQAHAHYRPRIEAQARAAALAKPLDVERLARAFDLNGVNWPARWGDNDFAWLARQVAAEYARLGAADNGEGSE